MISLICMIYNIRRIREYQMPKGNRICELVFKKKLIMEVGRVSEGPWGNGRNQW